MYIRYFLGAIISTPLLPLMYYHGEKIRHSVPELPEAKGVEGEIRINTDQVFRLLTIGESTIAGIGAPTHEEAFTGSLAKKLTEKWQKNIHWKVYARSGYTAKRVYTKILPKITETEIDLIVIGLGGNDAFTLNRPWQWKKDIRLIIKDLQGRFGKKTPIFFTNMPPIKEFPAFTPLIKFVIGNLVEILGKTLEKEIAEHENVFYNAEIITLDAWSKQQNLQLSANQYFSDGVHPSVLTYKSWAGEMSEFIIKKI